MVEFEITFLVPRIYLQISLSNFRLGLHVLLARLVFNGFFQIFVQ